MFVDRTRLPPAPNEAQAATEASCSVRPAVWVYGREMLRSDARDVCLVGGSFGSRIRGSSGEEDLVQLSTGGANRALRSFSTQAVSASRYDRTHVRPTESSDRMITTGKEPRHG